MALSPQYSWPEPDNSSLVKNGAQDIRALGDAIDTSVWNVGYGQAGKNKIINGNFAINQRNFTSTTADGYNFDQWIGVLSDGTVTFSTQTFTTGAAPVAGYEGKNYLRCVVSGQTLTTARANVTQRIEGVRILAGQTATFSFWAKANTGTPEIGVQLQQNFGTGGSPSASVNTSLKTTISTSWARYSLTFAVPSISGKTLGTNNNDNLTVQTWLSGGSSFSALSGGIGLQNNTFEIWGVQIEAGSVATAFQTATGTIQGELVACQRYFAKSYLQADAPGASTSTNSVVFVCPTASIGSMHQNVRYPITMRATPTITLYDQVGASGKVYKGANGKTSDVFYTGDAGFAGGTTDATSTTLMVFQYTASAEL